MNILIVEDEYYTRKAIKKVILDKYSNEVNVHMAENGLIALKIVDDIKPEIVITDIRMPELDGLELAEYIYKNHKKINLIIISGFAEFHYAQTAIKFGVKDYLIKPLNKEKLYEIMDKLFVLVEKNHQIDRMRVENQFNKAIFKNSGIKDIKIAELLRLQIEPTHYRVIILKAKESISPQNRDSIYLKLEEVFDKLVFAIPHLYNHNEIIIFTFKNIENKVKTEGTIYDHKLKEDIFQIKKAGMCILNDSIVMAVSNFHPVTSNFNNAVEEAQYFLLSYYFHGWNKIYEFENEENKEYNINLFSDDFRILEHLIFEGKQKDLDKHIGKIFSKIKNERDLFNFTHGIIKHININNITFNNPIAINLSNFNTLEELKNYITLILSDVCNKIRNKDIIGQQSLINKIKRYLEENYYEDLSLEKISNDVYYLNPSYLSRLFKEETGNTLSNYLLKIRMNKAMDLLKEGDLPISKISSFVGYHNDAYFIKIFKKHFGLTPGQAKKK